MTDSYKGYRTKRYSVTHGGHEIALEFDKKLIVWNRATLFVDGEAVDAKQLMWGDRHLETTLPDGTEIDVLFTSGVEGELVRAQLKVGEGTWQDLVDREAAGTA